MSKVRTRTSDSLRSARSLLGAAAVLALASLIASSGAVSAQEPEVATDGIDGTWTVNTEIGSFEGSEEQEPFSSSWIGFRVAEVLRNIGDAEAVGRTPAVSGELSVTGSTIDSATIEVDLTRIRSDQSRRDPAIQGALDTATFPTATFTSTAAVDLGAVPEDGVPFEASVPGTLTIRGVGQDVELPMAGQRVGDIVVVVGTLPIDFTAFDVTMPVLGPVISVEDTGSLEWQLFFERQP